MKAIHPQGSAMQGFDAEFKDLDQYIRVITDRIWEGRRIDDIRQYYSDPCVVETPSSVSTSLQAVVDGTKATLVMFPDRRLLAEDVIQSGDAAGGFLSSHRIISPMTHLGDGTFGKASGKGVQVRTIADCVCKDNRIVHEWLVRDQGAIALQIGMTPKSLAQQWINERGDFAKPVAGAAPAGYVSHVSTHPHAQAYAQAIQALSRGQADAMGVYDEAVHHLGPNGSTRYGHVQTLEFWAHLFSNFAVQSFTVEHLALQSDPTRPARIAMRWRVKAVHAFDNKFAQCQRDMVKPSYEKDTNREIEIMGINHAEMVNGKVIREWVLIDDVALWMQVLSGKKA